MSNADDPLKRDEQAQDGSPGPSTPAMAADRAREYRRAAARLEQELGALAESMDEIDRIAASLSYSTYMAQVVAERARWQQLKSLAQPEETLAATLADPDARRRLLNLLAPSLVFPAATPMQIDLSGEMLHAARQAAELYKENLRKQIVAEIRQIDAMSDAA